MKRSILISAGFFVMFSTFTHADDGQYFKKGDIELGFSGSYNNINFESNGESENIDFFYADLKASYFIIDNFSFGMNTAWFYLPEVESFEAVALGLEGNVKYHYQVNKNFVPYLGVHAGYYYADAEIDGESEDDSIKTIGLHGGCKIPINNNIFFDIQLKWTDYDMPWDDIDLSATQVLLGLNMKI